MDSGYSIKITYYLILLFFRTSKFILTILKSETALSSIYLKYRLIAVSGKVETQNSHQLTLTKLIIDSLNCIHLKKCLSRN